MLYINCVWPSVYILNYTKQHPLIFGEKKNTILGEDPQTPYLAKVLASQSISWPPNLLKFHKNQWRHVSNIAKIKLKPPWRWRTWGRVQVLNTLNRSLPQPVYGNETAKVWSASKTAETSANLDSIVRSWLICLIDVYQPLFFYPCFQLYASTFHSLEI